MRLGDTVCLNHPFRYSLAPGYREDMEANGDLHRQSNDKSLFILRRVITTQ